MSEIVVAVDPGKVSGIALWQSTGPLFVETREKPVVDTVELVGELLRSERNVTVVTERFTISERTIKTALSLDALDINGWLTIESQRPRMEFPLVFQTPAQAKSFASDSKLKALGWYTKTLDGHANDAARHMLTYLVRTPYREALLPVLADALLSRKASR